jgi:hypothetical protein
MQFLIKINFLKLKKIVEDTGGFKMVYSFFNNIFQEKFKFKNAKIYHSHR